MLSKTQHFSLDLCKAVNYTSFMLLREWIQAENINISHLAEKLGKSRSTIYDYINGEFSPKGQVACKIVEISNGKVSFEEIYEPFLRKGEENVT